MTPRIDLSTAPSAMEALAASWSKTPPAKPVSAARAVSAPKPRASLPAPPVPSSAAPKPKPAPKPESNRGFGSHYLNPKDEEVAQRRMALELHRLRALLAPPEPEPAVYVMNLQAAIGVALLQAHRCRDNAFAGHLEVPPGPLVGQMLAMGLLCRIGSRNRILSTFAVAVRREVMKDIG